MVGDESLFEGLPEVETKEIRRHVVFACEGFKIKIAPRILSKSLLEEGQLEKLMLTLLEALDGGRLKSHKTQEAQHTAVEFQKIICAVVEAIVNAHFEKSDYEIIEGKEEEVKQSIRHILLTRLFVPKGEEHERHEAFLGALKRFVKSSNIEQKEFTAFMNDMSQSASDSEETIRTALQVKKKKQYAVYKRVGAIPKESAAYKGGAKADAFFEEDAILFEQVHYKRDGEFGRVDFTETKPDDDELVVFEREGEGDEKGEDEKAFLENASHAFLERNEDAGTSEGKKITRIQDGKKRTFFIKKPDFRNRFYSKEFIHLFCDVILADETLMQSKQKNMALKKQAEQKETAQVLTFKINTFKEKLDETYPEMSALKKDRIIEEFINFYFAGVVVRLEGGLAFSATTDGERVGRVEAIKKGEDECELFFIDTSTEEKNKTRGKAKALISDEEREALKAYLSKNSTYSLEALPEVETDLSVAEQVNRLEVQRMCLVDAVYDGLMPEAGMHIKSGILKLEDADGVVEEESNSGIYYITEEASKARGEARYVEGEVAEFKTLRDSAERTAQWIAKSNEEGERDGEDEEESVVVPIRKEGISKSKSTKAVEDDDRELYIDNDFNRDNFFETDELFPYVTFPDDVPVKAFMASTLVANLLGNGDLNPGNIGIRKITKTSPNGEEVVHYEMVNIDAKTGMGPTSDLMTTFWGDFDAEWFEILGNPENQVDPNLDNADTFLKVPPYHEVPGVGGASQHFNKRFLFKEANILELFEAIYQLETTDENDWKKHYQHYLGEDEIVTPYLKQFMLRKEQMVKAAKEHLTDIQVVTCSEKEAVGRILTTKVMSYAAFSEERQVRTFNREEVVAIWREEHKKTAALLKKSEVLRTKILEYTQTNQEKAFDFDAALEKVTAIAEGVEPIHQELQRGIKTVVAVIEQEGGNQAENQALQQELEKLDTSVLSIKSASQKMKFYIAHLKYEEAKKRAEEAEQRVADIEARTSHKKTHKDTEEVALLQSELESTQAALTSLRQQVKMLEAEKAESSGDDEVSEALKAQQALLDKEKEALEAKVTALELRVEELTNVPHPASEGEEREDASQETELLRAEIEDLKEKLGELEEQQEYTETDIYYDDDGEEDKTPTKVYVGNKEAIKNINTLEKLEGQINADFLSASPMAQRLWDLGLEIDPDFITQALSSAGNKKLLKRHLDGIAQFYANKDFRNVLDVMLFSDNKGERNSAFNALQQHELGEANVAALHALHHIAEKHIAAKTSQQMQQEINKLDAQIAQFQQEVEQFPEVQELAEELTQLQVSYKEAEAAKAKEQAELEAKRAACKSEIEAAKRAISDAESAEEGTQSALKEALKALETKQQALQEKQAVVDAENRRLFIRYSVAASAVMWAGALATIIAFSVSAPVPALIIAAVTLAASGGILNRGVDTRWSKAVQDAEAGAEPAKKELEEAQKARWNAKSKMWDAEGETRKAKQNLSKKQLQERALGAEGTSRRLNQLESKVKRIAKNISDAQGALTEGKKDALAERTAPINVRKHDITLTLEELTVQLEGDISFKKWFGSQASDAQKAMMAPSPADTVIVLDWDHTVFSSTNGLFNEGFLKLLPKLKALKESGVSFNVFSVSPYPKAGLEWLKSIETLGDFKAALVAEHANSYIEKMIMRVNNHINMQENKEKAIEELFGNYMQIREFFCEGEPVAMYLDMAKPFITRKAYDTARKNPSLTQEEIFELHQKRGEAEKLPLEEIKPLSSLDMSEMHDENIQQRLKYAKHCCYFSRGKQIDGINLDGEIVREIKKTSQGRGEYANATLKATYIHLEYDSNIQEDDTEKLKSQRIAKFHGSGVDYCKPRLDELEDEISRQLAYPQETDLYTSTAINRTQLGATSSMDKGR